MSDVDFGVVSGSTNDDIWTEEIEKNEATRRFPLVFACLCGRMDCEVGSMSPRERTQMVLRSVDDARLAAKLINTFPTLENEKLFALIRFALLMKDDN